MYSIRIHLQPIDPTAKKKSPYFLWDYDLSEVQVREILAQKGLSDEKRWLVERILTQARFEDVMKYLSAEEIQRALPHLRLPLKIKDRWEYALQIWSQDE